MLGPDVYGGYQKVCKMSSEDINFVNELDGVGAARRRIAERIEVVFLKKLILSSICLKEIMLSFICLNN